MTKLLYSHEKGPFYSKKFVWRRISNSISEYLEGRFEVSQVIFLFIFIIGKQTIVDIKHNVDKRPPFRYYIRIIFNSRVYHVTDQPFPGQHLVSSICRAILFTEEYYAVWPINTDYVK